MVQLTNTSCLWCYILLCFMLLPGDNGVNAAYRVDAHERARRHAYKPDLLIERRHLDKAHVTVRDLLGLNKYEEVEVSDHIRTAQGSEVWRLRETFLGIPVFDVSMTVTTDNEGHLTGDATGTFIQGIEDDISGTTPKLSESDVLNIAIEEEGDQDYQDDISNPKYQLEVYMDDSGKAHLVYYINYLLETDMVIKRPAFIIDANTGEVFLHWNSMDTISKTLVGNGGNEKSGIYKFSSKKYKVNLTQIGELCFLENDDVKVIDMENGTRKNDSDPIYYLCKDGFSDEVNMAASPAFDAYYNGNIVVQMFKEWFNMKILKTQAILRVHFSDKFENAFWDGKSCTFGDGGDKWYPLTVLDVMGHELAHGFTEQHSGLLYFGESGSINEAFSDITGETVEAYEQNIDWLIGYDVVKEGEALRYMEDPTLDNRSISHINNFTEDTNPHYGSGIYNHVFYKIVQEQLMDIKEVYRVFLYANEIYWHPKTDFTSGACDVMKVAYDLGKNVTIFREAFELVGIEPCDVTKHIQGLVDNRTLTGIKVAPDIHPIFSFSYPDWAANLTIRAFSECGNVNIKVTNDTFRAEEYNSETLLAEGTSDLLIEKLPGNQVFITLYPESTKVLGNVNLLVTYSCDNEYRPDDFYTYMFYSSYCLDYDPYS